MQSCLIVEVVLEVYAEILEILCLFCSAEEARFVLVLRDAVQPKKCREVGNHTGASSVDSGLGLVAGRWSVPTVILVLWLKWMMWMLS